MTPKGVILKELQKIRWVGPETALDLWNLKIHSSIELSKACPEELYERLCLLTGTKVDRCMLYVFRCIIYLTREPNPEPALTKWWNWKNRSL